ncbi:glycosyltransferase family 4 protein [Candidatus Saccharibacteria bacterium]|nr:glycosyltransferase family 4 protein [Candidatus Saccharibacteria bacterium]
MKVAITHDWLNQKVGGGENVVFELAKLYPNADIFTLVYNPKKFDKLLPNRRITKSYLQHFPSIVKKHPKLLLPFIKSAIGQWSFDDYDVVISTSSAWSKNINFKEPTKHICYCFSPARMLWDSWPGYLTDQKLGPIINFYIIRLVSKLRLWDYYRAQNGTQFIAISGYIATRIKKFYRRGSKVVYPPVELTKYIGLKTKKEDYYLVLSVLAKYKNIELAIRGFMASGRKLVIAGDGPDSARLRGIAEDADNISFTGRISDADKISLLAGARGFVFCSIEDFGITMVESIAAGTGVIALKGGGADEIVKSGQTGLFYDTANEESLNRAIVNYEKTFLAGKPINNSYVFEKFDTKIFRDNITSIVNSIYSGDKK